MMKTQNELLSMFRRSVHGMSGWSFTHGVDDAECEELLDEISKGFEEKDFVMPPCAYGELTCEYDDWVVQVDLEQGTEKAIWCKLHTRFEEPIDMNPTPELLYNISRCSSVRIDLSRDDNEIQASGVSADIPVFEGMATALIDLLGEIRLSLDSIKARLDRDEGDDFWNGDWRGDDDDDGDDDFEPVPDDPATVKVG